MIERLPGENPARSGATTGPEVYDEKAELGPKTIDQLNAGARESRVLLVDDDRTGRQIMATLLRNAGFHVDDVASGEQALRKMRLKPYAVVVTDYRMPEMNGLELASIIRASGSGGTWQSEPPILIALSGGLSELERQIAQAVFDRIIIKPVQASVLESTLRSVLENRA